MGSEVQPSTEKEMNRIYTSQPLRIRCKEYWQVHRRDWLFGLVIVAVLLVLPAIAEAACELIGAGYDPRIEVAA